MFLPFLFLSCVDLPNVEDDHKINVSEDALFEDWSEDWASLEAGWSQEQLTKEERYRLKSELEVLYFDRIVPYKKQLHAQSASQLLEIELAFGRLIYDIEHRRSRKISAKTAADRKIEVTQLKEESRQILDLLSSTSREKSISQEQAVSPDSISEKRETKEERQTSLTTD